MRDAGRQKEGGTVDSHRRCALQASWQRGAPQQCVHPSGTGPCNKHPHPMSTHTQRGKDTPHQIPQSRSPAPRCLWVPLRVVSARARRLLPLVVPKTPKRRIPPARPRRRASVAPGESVAGGRELALEVWDSREHRDPGYRTGHDYPWKGSVWMGEDCNLKCGCGGYGARHF